MRQRFTRRILIAGIGSDHGDDEIGWQIAQRVEQLCGDSETVEVRRARVPLDLLDWLNDFDVAHLCDAAGWLSGDPDRLSFSSTSVSEACNQKLNTAITDLRCSFAAGQNGGVTGVYRLIWQDGALSSADRSYDGDLRIIADEFSFRKDSSHGFGLIQVLQLAEAIDQLPEQVTVWAIEATSFRPENQIADKLVAEVDRVARLIVNALPQRISPKAFHAEGNTVCGEEV